MIPKSTVTLKDGDFCFVRRSDGGYVPFVCLLKRPANRVNFYGGIIKAIVKTPVTSELAPQLDVLKYAVVHVKCFKENNTPVVGNIIDRIRSEFLEKLKKDMAEMKVGFCVNVWGYKTILKYADEVPLPT